MRSSTGRGTDAPSRSRDQRITPSTPQLSKQHCVLLALAFEGGFGGEDLLGEMAGRVAEERLGASHARVRWRGLCRPREGRPTCPTELGPRQILSPALGAAMRQGDATLDAKLGAGWILTATAGAAHGRPLLHLDT
jgi:hypothetical protein